VKARDVMTSDVMSVRPDTPIGKIARLLLKRGISATPVVDDTGAPIGMVSEGDLIGRDGRDARRDWWLSLVADRNADAVTRMLAPEILARDVMTQPVVTVSEDTDVGEIARLLATYRIKRVPVVRDGRLIGIVSRADLLRALAAEPAGSPEAKREGHGYISSALASLDERFLHHRAEENRAAVPPPKAEADAAGVEAGAFRHLVADFEEKEIEERQAAREAAGARRRELVTELAADHVSDETWRALMRQARAAAEHGQTEFMLLRFPSALCSDGGRAINVDEADWPATLRGEAAEIFLRWEHELKPRRFGLAARVLDFPDGKPGDIGLFLSWRS